MCAIYLRSKKYFFKFIKILSEPEFVELKNYQNFKLVKPKHSFTIHY